MRFLLTFYVLNFVSVMSQGQEIRFTAESDARQVIAGAIFSLDFTIENADVDHFTAPDFSPFKVVNGPSQSMRSSFVNGVGTRSVGFGYMLQATRTGKFTIQPASVTIGGKLYRSNPVTIEVLKSQEGLAGQIESDILIRAEVDTTHVYIGQQVMIRYKLYTQVNVESYNILTESNYAGCYAQALDTYKEPVLKEVFQGRQYSTKVLRKVAVFPQQAGRIDIDPLVVQVGFSSSSTVRRGLFSSFAVERKNLNSNALSLNVRSPHTEAPVGFSGAVGNFNPRFHLHPREVTTDDAITLTLSIVGNGDIKAIRSPSLILPEGLEVFEPKIRDEKMVNATDSVRCEKTVEYLIIGKIPGNYKLKPSFKYLEPESGQFKEVVDSFEVSIKQGKISVSSGGDHQLGRSDQELYPPVYDQDLQKISPTFSRQLWYPAAYVISTLVFFLMGWKSKQKKSKRTELKAIDKAKVRLENAKLLFEAGNHSSFYDEVALGLKQYLCHWMDIPQSDVTRQRISEGLAVKLMAPERQQQILSILDNCDMAIYAGLRDPTKMEKIYQESLEILEYLNAQEPL